LLILVISFHYYPRGFITTIIVDTTSSIVTCQDNFSFFFKYSTDGTSIKKKSKTGSDQVYPVK
jgi:hypothetical protein